MRQLLKPMDLRDILDNSFSILRERFWTFQGVIFYSFLPAFVCILLALIIILAVSLTIIPASNIDWNNFNFELYFTQLSQKLGFVGFLALILLGFLFMVTSFVGSILYVHGSIRLFQAGFLGEQCTAKEAFKGVLSKLRGVWIFLYFIFAFLLQMVVSFSTISINFFFTFLIAMIVNPALAILIQIIYYVLNFGLNFAVNSFFFLIPIIIIIEDANIIKAITRSFSLPAKHRWRVIGAFIFSNLIIFAISMILLFLIITIGLLGYALLNTYNNLLIYVIGIIFVFILLFLCLSIIAPFNFGPLTAIYYDLVIRKEGFDLMYTFNNQSTNFVNWSMYQ